MVVHVVLVISVLDCQSRVPGWVQAPVRALTWFEISAPSASLVDSAMMSTLCIFVYFDIIIDKLQQFTEDIAVIILIIKDKKNRQPVWCHIG